VSALDDGALDAFAEEVGAVDPVTCVGGRTQWHVGGDPIPGTREVHAPSGIVSFEPAEMTVRVRAGTTVAELDAALAEGGQMVPLDPFDPVRATVGGVLAVGHSGLRRLRYGPIRDTLLEARYVGADGRVVKAGGPVVKNVSGFDLCRVLVGSLGTIGFIAEVVLRAQPRPAASQWLVGVEDPFVTRRRLFRPSSILWDGARTWVLLEGHPADVASEAASLGGVFTAVDGPPVIPAAWTRSSVVPGAIPDTTAEFVAELGVGTIHRPADPDAPPHVETDTVNLHLNERVRSAFDSSRRLNPGRDVTAR
jgi:glycolate oxidase FAD binding subunit